MIISSDFNRLAPNEKAALIYAQAHGDVATRLWRAALGTGSQGEESAGFAGATTAPTSSLDTLLAQISQRGAVSDKVPAAFVEPAFNHDDFLALPTASPPKPTGPLTTSVSGLGPNAQYTNALVAAAERTNVPAAALAAIVDAEAAKARDGSWKTASRNPRSSAAGLGQFLGGTWQSEAERAGTWLHDVAKSQGWLGDNGRVLPAARSSLLALRYDATASINATADYASRSLAQLRRAGIDVGNDVSTIARSAYLGHHLGTGDAVRFLTDGLSSGRAKQLLNAQVGSAAASLRIAKTGDATAAHRAWLVDFVDRHITPDRFAL